jgi:hypothetical protein
MNKKVLIAASLLTTMFVNAQESAGSGDEVVKNKKGNEILPKAGDIGLGFNAAPMVDLVINSVKLNSGGVFGNTQNTNQYVLGSNNQIVGKYFLSAKAAIRGKIGVNTLSGSITNRVQDSKALYDANFGTATDISLAQQLTVEDKYKFSKRNLLISAGYEMRRGYRRLQGYFGGEVAFGGGGAKETFTYGNDYSDLYPTHYTNGALAGGSFNTTIQHNPFQQGRQERVLFNNYRGNFRVGMRGFIGVEYFVFTKISIGGEFGWGWSYTTRTNRISTVEIYENGNTGIATVYNEERSNDSNEKTKGFAVDNNGNPGNPFSMTNTTGGNGNTAGTTGLSGVTGAITILFHF